LEVDFSQMHRRKASALNQICHVAAQVGVDDLWASNAHDGTGLVFGQVANFKNASLFGLYQEHHFVLNFGGHGRGHGHFGDAFNHLLNAHGQLNVQGRLLLRGQNSWRIGLLQRHVFQINTLNLKHRRIGLVCGLNRGIVFRGGRHDVKFFLQIKARLADFQTGKETRILIMSA
jgi:hypothetical protein